MMQLENWKSKKVFAGVGVIGVGLILSLSNPSRDTYSQHLAQKVNTDLKENICSEASDLLGGFVTTQCNNLVDRGGNQLAGMIKNSTNRNNFLLFSRYKTDISLMRETPIYETEAIGFLGQVWVYRTEVISPDD